jgi:hypothetical protein
MGYTSDFFPTLDPCCTYAYFNGTTTLCGDVLVNDLSGMIAAVSKLGIYLIGALGVYIS